MRRLGIGVIGVGSMGRSHVMAFSGLPDARVMHVADVSADRASAVADEFHVPRVSARAEDLVADPEVEAVVVATPEADHFVPTLAALNAGKHVLVEKPLATTVTEAREIQRAAARLERQVMVGHSLRFEPRYWMVKKALERGEFGTVVSMYVRRNRPRSLFEQYSRTHPAFETGVHDLDLLLWYTRDRVRRVHAAHRYVTGRMNPDGFWSLVEFEGGTVALMESVWLIPDAAHVFRGDGLELIGTLGTAHLDISDPGLRFWTGQGQMVLDPILDPQPITGISSALRAETAYFTDCILHERSTDWVSLDDAVHGVAVITAIIEAASSGKDVELDPEWKGDERQR